MTTKMTMNENVVESSYPCYCCGMGALVKTAKTTRNTKGIKVIGGHIGKAGKYLSNTVSHITTKNGPLTIVIRHTNYGY